MCCVGFGGSQIPAQIELAPVSFSDYRKVSTEGFRRWYGEQRVGVCAPHYRIVKGQREVRMKKSRRRLTFAAALAGAALAATLTACYETVF